MSTPTDLKKLAGEHFEATAGADEAVRRIEDGEKVADVARDLAESGEITEDEAAYLSVLGDAADKMATALVEGEDPGGVAGSLDGEKTASMNKEAKGTVRRALGNAADWMKNNKETIFAASAGLPAAFTLGAYGKDAVRELADPMIEQYRYNKMMGLPGDPVSELSGTSTADSFFVPSEEGGEPLSERERNERALRRAFEMLHESSPEMTARPEVARATLRNSLPEDPDRFMKAVAGDGQMLNDAKATRNREKRDRRETMRRGLDGIAQSAVRATSEIDDRTMSSGDLSNLAQETMARESAQQSARTMADLARSQMGIDAMIARRQERARQEARRAAEQEEGLVQQG